MPHEHGIMGKLHKQERLENPQRVQELDPAGTLKRLELDKGQTVCDIGAGTGIFTLAAAELTDGMVYALETDDDMADHIMEKARQTGKGNIRAIKVSPNENRFDLPDDSIDLALVVNVLHEIEDKSAFLDETKRILKMEGRIVIIEFHARQTPFGPPADMRLAPEAVEDLLQNAGLELVEQFDLGDNFYVMAFQMQSS